MKEAFVLLAVLISTLLSARLVAAQGGHGPIFGLATPTLPQGAWNADLTVMSPARSGRALMVRETIRYGVTPDVQLNLSVPQRIEKPGAPLRTRVGTMMGGMGDAELSVFWRFHAQYPGVGKRFESTIILGGLYPLTNRRAGIRLGPGIHTAAVTGYVSRKIYSWGGGGFQHRFEHEGDRPGDLFYLSIVLGWRPILFRGDYPKPDWRLFIEFLGEFVGQDRSDGVDVDASGGERFFIGPAVLGLYGTWGIGGGAIFPVYQNHHDDLGAERARITLNVSYWF